MEKGGGSEKKNLSCDSTPEDAGNVFLFSHDLRVRFSRTIPERSNTSFAGVRPRRSGRLEHLNSRQRLVVK